LFHKLQPLLVIDFVFSNVGLPYVTARLSKVSAGRFMWRKLEHHDA